jgi:hypothetical protein
MSSAIFTTQSLAIERGAPPMAAQSKSAELMGINRRDLVNASSGWRMIVRKPFPHRAVQSLGSPEK